MYTSRPIIDADLTQYASMMAECYPGQKANSPEDLTKLEGRLRRSLEDSRFTMHGIWDAGHLVAGMRYHSYRMNCFGHTVLCGGAAVVAVRMNMKKRGLAKRLMSEYLNHYRSQGAPFAALYAFRPDFYYDMGFGYGPPVFVFSVAPKDLPCPEHHPDVRYLTKGDIPALARAFNAYASKHTGAFEESEIFLSMAFELQPEVKYVAVCDGNDIVGYVKFKFEQANPTNFVCNDIKIFDIVCDDRRALGRLFSFLHNQFDQVRRVQITTYDEQLYYAFRDVRDGTDNLSGIVTHQMCTGGMGIMYRVINTRSLFETLHDHSFGDESMTVAIEASDTFLSANNERLVVRFEHGHPTVVTSGHPDVSIALSIADFSSLILGAARFDRLYAYGKADISDSAFVNRVARLFATADKPVCLTRF